MRFLLLSLRLALQTAILAVAVAGAAKADDQHAASSGSVQAKLSYCKDCHGASAQGYRGYFPIPRLAGQQTEYLENQLRAFHSSTRPGPTMSCSTWRTR